jgi:hypothetical protein
MVVSPDQKATKTKHRRWPRYAVLGIAAVLFGAGAYWYIVYPNYYQYVIHLDKQPASQTSVSTQVDVTFTVPIRSSVELIVGDVRYGPWDLKGGGYYTQPVTLPFPENKVELRATAVHAFHRFSSTDSMIVKVQPDYPTTPTLSSSADTISKGPLLITGIADPNCSIDITVNGSFSKTVAADDKGLFSWKLDDPKPGDYKISAVAWNAADVNGPRSQELVVKYVPLARQLSAFVSLKNTRVDCEAQLPKDDPRVVDLIEGKTSCADFIKEVFAGIEINNFELRSLFLDVTPQISIKENTATVFASSNPNNQINLPSLKGSFALIWPADFSKNDTLLINVKDYEVTSFTPAPSRIDEKGATWVGSSVESDQPNRIETGVRFRPLHRLGNFVKFIQFSPYDTIPYPYSIIPEMLYGCLLLFPIIWAVWILRRSPLDEQFDKRFKRATIYLGAWCFITPIVDFVLARTYLVAEPSQRILREFKFAGWSALVIAGSLLIAFAFSGLLFIWICFRNRTQDSHSWTDMLRFLPQALLARLLAATILVLLIMSLLWIAIFRSEKGLDRYRLWPALIGFLLVGTLLIVPAWVSRARPREKSNRRWAKRIGLILVGGLLLAVVSYGLFGSRENTFWNYNPALSGPEIFEFSLVKLSYMFGYLGGLVLYILFLGILVVLKTIEGRSGADNRLLLGFEKLLFVSFIVGITWHFYLLPLPFLLAFLAYRCVMVSPTEHKQLDDDELVNEVFARRKESTITSLEKLKSRQNALDNLRKKFGSGEMPLPSFEIREKALRATIQEQQKETQFTPSSQSRTYDVEDLILGLGPHKTNWENGKHAAIYSLWLAIPFALVNLGISIAVGGGGSKTFVPLSMAMQVIGGVSDWLILAFFFGYFFKYIKGHSGLKKGLTLAVAYTLCILPLVVREFSSSILAMLFYLTPNFIFLPFLGIMAFDARSFRQIMGEGYSWKKLIRFEDNPTLLAFTTIPFTTVAITVLSFLTGQSGKIIPLLLKAIIPEGSNGPPH